MNEPSALERAAEEDRRRGRCYFRPHEVWRDGPSGESYQPHGHESEKSWLVSLPKEYLGDGIIGPPRNLEIHRCIHCGCLFTESKEDEL